MLSYLMFQYSLENDSGFVTHILLQCFVEIINISRSDRNRFLILESDQEDLEGSLDIQQPLIKISFDIMNAEKRHDPVLSVINNDLYWNIYTKWLLYRLRSDPDRELLKFILNQLSIQSFSDVMEQFWEKAIERQRQKLSESEARSDQAAMEFDMIAMFDRFLPLMDNDLPNTMAL